MHIRIASYRQEVPILRLFPSAVAYIHDPPLFTALLHPEHLEAHHRHLLDGAEDGAEFLTFLWSACVRLSTVRRCGRRRARVVGEDTAGVVW